MELNRYVAIERVHSPVLYGVAGTWMARYVLLQRVRQYGSRG